MASDVVIRAEGLGKNFVIGHQVADRVPTFRDSIARATANFARMTRDLLRGKALIAGDEVEEFWALRDVDFEIRRGDVVGIIGRNGAGKSTLLKILSRITEPSEGRVEIRGRVASLLEVGTGFHPELTGRENIYLNGAILGMSRAEIRRKFDEIVAFSEVEKFLDTPVKRYSSGMYVRLAFAVAAHLEPEILIVDEVLAVGDAEFQKKCLGKMGDISSSGRTILFVSHNTSSIKSLCSSAVILNSGRVQKVGSVEECLAQYASGFGECLEFSGEHNQNALASITQIVFKPDKTSAISIKIDSKIMGNYCLEVNLRDKHMSPVAFAEVGFWNPAKRISLREGLNNFEFNLDTSALAAGTYIASFSVTIPGSSYLANVADAICFEVADSCWPGEVGGLHQSQGHGSVRLRLDKSADS